MGGQGQKLQNKRTKFLNLLILEHLKKYFIEALNTFLMCFEINGLKNLKLTILSFFCLVHPFIHTTLHVLFKEAIYLELIVFVLYFHG